jgi:hypothetical protein
LPLIATVIAIGRAPFGYVQEMQAAMPSMMASLVLILA